MKSLPFILYFLCLNYKIWPRNVLELVNSKKIVNTQLGSINFTGPEQELINYLINTAFIRFMQSKKININNTTFTEFRDIHLKQAIDFLNRFTPDRVSWLKALFRLFGGEQTRNQKTPKGV